MKEEQSSIDAVKALIERGKQKGTLSYEEIMDTLQGFELSAEQIDSIYEHFGAIGIKISSDGSAKADAKNGEAEEDEENDVESFKPLSANDVLNIFKAAF